MEIKSLDEKILFLQIDNIINLDEDIENYQDKIIPFSAFYQDKYHDSIEDQYSDENEFEYLDLESNYNSSIDYIDPEKLNEDEVMMKITEEIDTYYNFYKLPPLKITNHEWDIFFDKTYSLLSKKAVAYKLYEVTSEIVRLTLASSLVNRWHYIRIENLINNIGYLNKSCGIYMIKKVLEDKELERLQDDLLRTLKIQIIINFEEKRKKLLKNIN